MDFHFLKTGKSKSDGVLLTHGYLFKFTKNNVNRNGTIHYCWDLPVWKVCLEILQPSTEGSALPSDPLPDAVPAPSPLPSTLEESAEFSSYCGPNKFAKVCSSGPGGAAMNCCDEYLLSEDADF